MYHIYKIKKLWKGCKYHLMIETSYRRKNNLFGIGILISDKYKSMRDRIALVLSLGHLELEMGLDSTTDYNIDSCHLRN